MCNQNILVMNKLTQKQKDTINMLKNFYIDQVVDLSYDQDFDLFWEDHEDIMSLESELDLLS